MYGFKPNIGLLLVLIGLQTQVGSKFINTSSGYVVQYAVK